MAREHQLNEARQGFFRRIRFRIRLAWLASTAQQLAPYLGLLIVALLAADWLTDWDSSVAWSLAALAGFSIGLVVRAATFRISEWETARAAERGLGARDALTTALEFDDGDNDVHQAIQDEANRIAVSSDPAAAIPVRAQLDRLRQLGLAAAIALLIAFLPPFSDTPALSSDLDAALEAEAEEVERIAEAIAGADVENAEEIIAELERLAEELRLAESLEEALQSLEDANTRLDAQIDPDFLAQKAAVQGLARDLALRPLVGGSTLDAASQFKELAESLDQLSEPELRALEDRLNDLAQSQAAGNPQLSSQLSQAASSLAAGDMAGAQQALADAADGQNAGVSDARSQQAITETQNALDAIQTRLGSPGSSATLGDGEGGEQPGDGQAGEPGVGPGGQQGTGAGGPSGQISGVAPGEGGAAGQGGQGTVGAGDGTDYGTNVETSTVYDPADLGSVADLLQVHISGGGAQGEIIGTGDAPTQQGDSIVPYASVLPQYLNEAADALAALRLPPSMRTIVQTYFAQLAEAAR